MSDNKPREFWIKQHPTGKNISNKIDLYTATEEEPQNPGWIHVIDYNVYEDLSIKIQRTVSAAYSALLEMSAWMGIPEKKRQNQINNLMENVKFCAEHDLRHIDESQALAEMSRYIRDTPFIQQNEELTRENKILKMELERVTIDSASLLMKRDCEIANLEMAIKSWKRDEEINIEHRNELRAQCEKLAAALDKVAFMDGASLDHLKRIARESLNEYKAFKKDK